MDLDKEGEERACALLDHCFESLQTKIELFGTQDHPDIAKSLSRIGMAHYKLGNLSEALDFLRQSFDMSRRLCHRKDSIPLVRIQYNQARILDEMGEIEPAFDLYIQVLDVLKSRKDQKELLAKTLYAIGNLFMKMDSREEDALRLFQKYLSFRHELGTAEETDLEVARACLGSGIALEKLERLAEACTFLERALNVYQALFEKRDHPEITLSLFYLAKAHVKMGNMPEGEVPRESAKTIDSANSPFWKFSR